MITVDGALWGGTGHAASAPVVQCLKQDRLNVECEAPINHPQYQLPVQLSGSDEPPTADSSPLFHLRPEQSHRSSHEVGRVQGD